MDVPLVQSGMNSPFATTPVTARSPRPSSISDPHSVQLSHYDGRLLLDRDRVPEGDGFDYDDDSGDDSWRARRTWSSIHHSLVAVAFVAASVAYAVVLLVINATDCALVTIHWMSAAEKTTRNKERQYPADKFMVPTNQTIQHNLPTSPCQPLHAPW